MAFAPDGRSIAVSASHDNAIWFYDPGTGKAVRQLKGHTGAVFAAIYSKDGTRLASGSADGTARLWDLATGGVLGTFEHGKPVVDVALSGDGKLLATKTAQKVFLWDIATRKSIHQFEMQSADVRSLAFSPDSKLLASAATVWDTLTGKKSYQCENSGGYGYPTTFSPDGKIIAVGGYNGVLGLYDATTGKELPQSKAGWNRGPLSGVQFGPDGRTLATRGNDGVSLWYVATRQPLYRLPSKEFLRSLGISPDGKVLATFSDYGVLCFWDADTGKELLRIRGTVDQQNLGLSPVLAFSSDSKTLVSAGFSNVIRHWNVANGEELQQFIGHDRGVYFLAFAPDGKNLISASTDQTMRRWEVASGKELSSKTQVGSIRGSSPDAKLGAVRIEVKGANPSLLIFNLHILNLADGSELRFLKDVGCNWCVFSPDAKSIAVAATQMFWPDREETIHLIELATGNVRARFTGHLGFLEGAAFSPDGRMLASANDDTTCLIWDVTGRLQETGTATGNFSPMELDRLWDDLAGPDAVKAFRAIWVLAGSADRVLPFSRRSSAPCKVRR